MTHGTNHACFVNKIAFKNQTATKSLFTSKITYEGLTTFFCTLKLYIFSFYINGSRKLRCRIDGRYSVSLSAVGLSSSRVPFTRSLSSHVRPTARLLQLFKFTPLKREKASFYILMFRKRKEMTSHSKGVIRDNLGVQGCTDLCASDNVCVTR